MEEETPSSEDGFEIATVVIDSQQEDGYMFEHVHTEPNGSVTISRWGKKKCSSDMKPGSYTWAFPKLRNSNVEADSNNGGLNDEDYKKHDEALKPAPRRGMANEFQNPICEPHRNLFQYGLTRDWFHDPYSSGWISGYTEMTTIFLGPPQKIPRIRMKHHIVHKRTTHQNECTRKTSAAVKKRNQKQINKRNNKPLLQQPRKINNRRTRKFVLPKNQK